MLLKPISEKPNDYTGGSTMIIDAIAAISSSS